MKKRIAVVGADNSLGRRVAREAYHRGYAVTAVVRDQSLLDSVKYSVRESADYSVEEDEFDAVIDVTGKEIKITKGDMVSSVCPAERIDADGRRTGQVRLSDKRETYVSEEDLALAVVDVTDSDGQMDVFAGSDPAPDLPEENSGRRRYVAVPDKGIAGKVFELVMDSLQEYVIRFLTDSTMIIAEKGKTYREYSCDCFRCDDDVWMVIYMKDGECVTLILDEGQDLVTEVLAELMPKRTQLVRHRILFGALRRKDKELPFRRHAFTDELVGQKITWHYSPYVNITHCFYTEMYMRNSLRSMKPVPDDAAPEARFDAEDRIRRWSNIFFEEPAQYIRFNPHLYMMCMREATRNRIDPLQGGGDMVLVINTRRMRDYGRGFSRGKGAPGYDLVSVCGDWDDLPDPMDTAESPYLV